VKIYKYPQVSTNIHFWDTGAVFIPELYSMAHRILHKGIILSQYRKVYRIIRKYISPFYPRKLKIIFVFAINKIKKNKSSKNNSTMLYHILLSYTFLLLTLFIRGNFASVKCILRKETITEKYLKVPSIYIKNQHLCNDS
jgi:hypothetical protein